MSPGEWCLRLDTEDFLTPESDQALADLLRVLEERGSRAVFPLTASKLRSWLRRGRSDLVAALARQQVGYHSDTHSLHPTIAEEMAPLGWRQGQRAFAAREEAGFDLVRRHFGPPVCYTQPGGNWTAAALPVLRSWGVTLEYSEGWNSYLDFGARPCHYLGVLHWSAPVLAPKPFLSQLPQCLPRAVEQVLEGARCWKPGDPPLNVVAHPTELCTTAFWDAVNFRRGAMPPPALWRPAPLRPPLEIHEAVAAFARYLDLLREQGLRLVSLEELTARHADRAPGTRLGPAAVQALARATAADVDYRCSGGLALSAAEIAWVLVHAAVRRQEPIPQRVLEGPPEPPPPTVAGSVSRQALWQAAAALRQHLAAKGCVPTAVPLGRAAAAPAPVVRALAEALLDDGGQEFSLRPTLLAAERHVKAEADLHWDWPVFPEGFAPRGLRQQALLQCWTLKPAPLEAPVQWERWGGQP